MFNPRSILTLLMICGLASCAGLPLEVPRIVKGAPSAVGDGVIVESANQAKAANPKLTRQHKVFLDLVNSNQTAAAEAELLEALSRHPNEISTATNLGLLYAETGRSDDAMEVLSQLVTKHPDACPAQVKLAQLYQQIYRFNEAEAAYVSCLGARPEYSKALLNAGIFYELYRGDFALALSFYERYQASMPAPDQRVAGWIADLSRRDNQIAEAH